ncbi:MAG: carboxypeptidase regulatory-like domain-containing protein [Bacteroidaceae bacterium]|nr:carboxypeptidase regulatory-like domain-containing protein [Bacteroidaceae bacterium]
MKTEDIDKRIEMPDVDKEWARFEQEVISGGTTRRSALAWALSIGIAASLALLLIFDLGKEPTEQTPPIAQTEEIKPQPTPQPVRKEVQAKEQETATKASTPFIAQNKKLAMAKANAPAASSLDIPAREYTGAVQKFNMNDLEDLAFESVDQALQEQIASLKGNSQEQIASLPNYVPDENEIRLLPQGVIGGSHDSPPNDSILYLVNGEPQPKENNKWLGRRSYLDYFKGQHLLVDKVMRYMNEEAKQRYIEKFGEAAKHGVIEYFCVEDTLCDYYMNQHEELKASRRRVSGVVYDENDEPLAHTMIYIWHGKRVWGFETTDSLGNFTFWVPRTDVKMEFTYVGFYKAVVVEPSDTFQTIYLLPNDNLKSLRKNLKF